MVEHQPETLDRVFHAVADATRREILGKLAEHPQMVTQLAEPFPISLNAISKHVVVLEKAGLIRRDVRGREHWLSLAPEPLHEASSWMNRYRIFWGTRLDALETHLLAERRGKRLRRTAVRPVPND